MITGRLDPREQLAPNDGPFSLLPLEIKHSPLSISAGKLIEGGCQGYNHATVLLLGYNAFPFLSACKGQSEKDKEVPMTSDTFNRLTGDCQASALPTHTSPPLKDSPSP